MNIDEETKKHVMDVVIRVRENFRFGDAKVNPVGSIVVISYQEFDLTTNELQEFREEAGLKSEDSFDVNSEEGLRIVIGDSE